MGYKLNDLLECKKGAECFIECEIYEIIGVNNPAIHNIADIEYQIYDSHMMLWWLTEDFIDDFFIIYNRDVDNFDYAMQII